MDKRDQDMPGTLTIWKVGEIQERRYEAANMNAALDMARRDLHPDYDSVPVRNRIPGGNTWHVQFGSRVSGGALTLSSTYVAQWMPQA